MPLRVLGYMLEIWMDHVARHPEKPLPLPPILPFVLNQGPQGWNVSVHFEDMFELSGSLDCFLPHLPRFQHVLMDLTTIDPRHEEKDATLRVVLELMKLIRQKGRLREYFAWLAGELMSHPQPVELIRKLLTYVWTTDTSLDAAEIARTVEVNSELRDSVMTIAEQLIEKGRSQGELKGQWMGKLQMLQQMLNLPVTSSEELSSLEAGEIQRRFESLEKDYHARFKP
jgi:hypothetical protein